MIRVETRQKWMLLLLFFATAIGSTAQQYGQVRVRVYRSKADSIRHLLIEKNIDEALKHKPPRQKKIDSLMELHGKIFREAIIFKMVYKPGRNFVLTDSLENTSDLTGIRKVCVYGKSKIPDILWRCRDVEALEFINTSLKRLPKELNSLKNLKKVYIYNNRSVARLRLYRNTTVISMTITGENPDGLPRSFRKFKGLKILDLTENGLTKFPNGARHNKKLTELSLQRNNLTLKGRIKRHPYLERLSLHNNAIEHVPASIKNCRNLKKLNFNSNKISSVDPAIGRLKKLEYLSFYNNQLTAIPKGVYRIRSLREIDLFHNRISALDAGFANWQNLLTLYLSHNKIVSLPENIDTLKSLEGLYVWDNRLGKLPESLGKIPSMEFLRVNHNYLKKIPESLLRLDKLQELDISHNYLTEVPEGIFNYPHLKILAMVNNPWNERMLRLLPEKIETLRKREVFIHASDE